MERASVHTIVDEANDNISSSITTAQEMAERNLRMRALAYLAQIKSDLLTETIYDVDRSRQDAREKNKLLSQQQKIIEEQNKRLERLNLELEERVRHEVAKSIAKDQILFQQSKMADMGEMLSMIAHQWRQPLSVISMASNNILLDIELDSIEPSALRHSARTTLEQTQYLSDTIEDFRDYFRPTTQKERISVSEVLEQANRLMEASLTQYHIELIRTGSSSTKIPVYKNELIQVLINIVHNAKDALLQNGQTHKRITVDVQENDHAVNISICDNGGGISDKIMTKVFEPYFTTKGVTSGTGLGLYMSKMIIERHLCGTITAKNDDEGACITISLPKEA